VPEREVVSGGGGVEYRLGTYRERCFAHLTGSSNPIVIYLN
jgi:hypothetical protein